MNAILVALTAQALLAADSTSPTIRPRHHPDYCVTLQNTQVGSAVYLTPCDGSAGQAWTYDQGRLMSDGVCLNVQPNVANGNPALVGDCKDGGVAQWLIDGTKLHVANTEQCLDLPLGLPLKRPLRVWRCGLAPLPEGWSVNAVPDGNTVVGKLTLADNPNLCVAVQGGITYNGTPIQLDACSTTDTEAQTWTYESGALMAFGKCLSATSSSAGAPIMLSDCVPQAPQWWNRSNGIFQMANTALCLDGNSPTTAAGTQLFLRPCLGTAAQNWELKQQ